MIKTPHCTICGKKIIRRKRKNGLDESITQYKNRKTCGKGTPCFGEHNRIQLREIAKREITVPDTTVEEIEYGKDIVIWQNGKKLKRFYPIKFCKGCGKQLKVKVRKKGPEAGRLQTNSEFLMKTSYCDMACQAADNKKKADARIKKQMKKKKKKKTFVEVKLTPVDIWFNRAIV